MIDFPRNLYTYQFKIAFECISKSGRLTGSCAAILFPCRMRANRLYSVLVRYFGSMEIIDIILQTASKSSRTKPSFGKISGTSLMSIELSADCVRVSRLLISSQHVSES